jgi:hypothetical protein
VNGLTYDQWEKVIKGGIKQWRHTKIKNYIYSYY